MDGGTVSVDASNRKDCGSTCLETVRWPFPGFGCLDGSVFVSCFRFAGALAGLRRYAGVRMVNACARRSLPAECLEA